ncbi:hypothetical protein HMPREF0201_01884 [Cedecea davisae DSM 4568]|uniref:Uncharacterized protein n=1 Tax=Cedecea davisae DSM 4568 TaxID=566551 RepID=S3IY56_9ENTR|nr:hypothetical protein HMPREF0201_01884 [Cedecea davisae DSM 4568]
MVMHKNSLWIIHQSISVLNNRPPARPDFYQNLENIAQSDFIN